MEQLLGGIALAAVGAVTYVAYRHPVAYVRLSVALYIVVTIAIAGGAVWNMSNTAASIAAISGRSIDSNYIDTQHRLAGVAIPFWYSAAALGVLAYVWFLTTLPVWLLDDGGPVATEPKVRFMPRGDFFGFNPFRAFRFGK
jgi:hypothetical protein